MGLLMICGALIPLGFLILATSGCIEIGPARLSTVKAESLGYFFKPIRAKGKEFDMGAATTERGEDDREGGDGDETLHPVTFDHDFWFGETEVTSAQYKSRLSDAEWTQFQEQQQARITSRTLSFSDLQRAIRGVRWIDAIRYCNYLSTKENRDEYYKLTEEDKGVVRVEIVRHDGPGYRLPTEAEWEYSCRAGLQGHTYGFDNLTPGQAAFKLELTDFAWYSDNCKDGNGNYSQRPVHTRMANAYGIYDMHGSVWEWCWEEKDGKKKRVSFSDRLHIARGGSFTSQKVQLRCANRQAVGDNYKTDDGDGIWVGLRVAFTAAAGR